MAHDQALTERRLKYEYRVAEAIPKLYAIDPADPQAPAQRAQIAKDYPDLFHGETGIPNIVKEFEQHERLSESAQKQRDAVDARKEAADARRQGTTDAQTERERFTKEMANLRAELKAKAGPSDAERKAYGIASAKQDDLQKQLEGNQKFIDEQTTMKAAMEKNGHDTPDQDAMLAKLQKSRDTLQKEFDQHRITKNVLEGIRPELASPPATPAPVTEGDRPLAEPEPTGDEAAPAAVAPVNPNLAPTPAPVAPPVVVSPVAAVVPAPVVPVAPLAEAAAPVATPHPYEGKRVLQKSTGKYGTFTNGQFVAE